MAATSTGHLNATLDAAYNTELALDAVADTINSQLSLGGASYNYSVSYVKYRYNSAGARTCLVECGNIRDSGNLYFSANCEGIVGSSVISDLESLGEVVTATNFEITSWTDWA